MKWYMFHPYRFLNNQDPEFWLWNTLTNIWMRFEHSIGFKRIHHNLLKSNEHYLLDAYHEHRKKTLFLWSIQSPHSDRPWDTELMLRLPKWSNDCPWW